MNEFIITITKLCIVSIIFGTGFYAGVAICRQDTFKKATLFQIIKGVFFSIFLWPIAMAFLIRQLNSERDDAIKLWEEFFSKSESWLSTNYRTKEILKKWRTIEFENSEKPRI